MFPMLSVEEGQQLALSALVISSNVARGCSPGIVEVEPVSPAVAAEMRSLGYSILTPELLRALTGVGTVARTGRNKVIGVQDVAHHIIQAGHTDTRQPASAAAVGV